MIHTLHQRLIKLEGWIAALSLMLMLALSVFQIIARNFFDTGFFQIEIISRNLLIVAGMMGAILATSGQQHIKIDALATVLSDTILARLRIPVLLFSAFVCVFMCDASIAFFIDEWEFAPANERWIMPFTLIYPIGFALLTLHFLLLCFKRPE